MDSPTSRRRYVHLLGLSVALGLAGCADETSDPESAGGDDTSGDDTSGDDTTGDDTSGDDTNGGNTNGDDGSSDTDQQDSAADDSSQDDDDGNDDGAVDETGEGASGDRRLRDVFNWADSYVMEITSPEGSGRMVVNGEDMYSSWSVDGEQFETYRIGTDNYSVADGECYKFSFETPAGDEFDPEEPAESSVEYVATGTTRLDGEDVYEFDVGEGLYYLSATTGYPVRWVGADDHVVDFHSWGDVDPISPPDMECVEP